MDRRVLTLQYPNVNYIRFFLAIGLCLALTSCASIVSNATSQLAKSISSGVVNNNDPETVAAGAPAYLILIDGLISDSPDNKDLLMAGARLYSTYASMFVKDPQRAMKLADKAKNYGLRALCLRRKTFCNENAQSFDNFKTQLNDITRDDVPLAFTYAHAWGNWILAHSNDWHAIADLPKLDALLRHLLALNESYDNGAIHIMLGAIDTRLPKSLGGDPEQGRAHFERAISLSEGKNLIAKVLLANRYARLVFDRELHDAQLKEVIEAPVEAPGLTLSNTLAQREAVQLLNSADDYF